MLVSEEAALSVVVELDCSVSLYNRGISVLEESIHPVVVDMDVRVIDKGGVSVELVLALA